MFNLVLCLTLLLLEILLYNYFLMTYTEGHINKIVYLTHIKVLYVQYDGLTDS